MSTRREDLGPTFKVVESAKDRLQLEKEIIKILPAVEVSLEGLSDLALGRVIAWDQPRKLLQIRWDTISQAFTDKTESETGLRAYFKMDLFSTQLVFKTTTIRRIEDGTYHYRIPDFIFKKQKRGMLRVPLPPESAFLECNEGRFELLNLSIGGAKLKIDSTFKPTSIFTHCVLNLSGLKVTAPALEVKALRREKEYLGCKFGGLTDANKTQIKQFLIDALRVHFKENA